MADTVGFLGSRQVEPEPPFRKLVTIWLLVLSFLLFLDLFLLQLLLLGLS